MIPIYSQIQRSGATGPACTLPLCLSFPILTLGHRSQLQQTPYRNRFSFIFFPAGRAGLGVLCGSFVDDLRGITGHVSIEIF